MLRPTLAASLLLALACGFGSPPTPETDPLDDETRALQAEAMRMLEAAQESSRQTSAPDTPAAKPPKPAFRLSPSEVPTLPTIEPVTRDGPTALCADHNEALCAAANSADLVALEALWADGADLDCVCSSTHSARRLGAGVPIVRDFMKTRYRTWTTHETPLGIAASAGAAEMARWLLERGVDPDARRSEAALPLDLALAKGDRDVVLLLLGAGASAELADLGRCGDAELLGVMLHYGARAETIDLEGPIRDGDVETVIALVGYGADLSDMDADAVVWEGDLAMTRALLDAGLPPDQTGFQGQSMLTLFAERGDLAHVELLLERGADVEHSSHPFGVRPLSNAVNGGDGRVVARLLEAGADVHIEGPYRNGPLLKWAIDEGTVDVIPPLLEHGARLPGDEDPLAYARRVGAGPGMIAVLEASAQ